MFKLFDAALCFLKLTQFFFLFAYAALILQAFFTIAFIIADPLVDLGITAAVFQRSSFVIQLMITTLEHDLFSLFDRGFLSRSHIDLRTGIVIPQFSMTIVPGNPVS